MLVAAPESLSSVKDALYAEVEAKIVNIFGNRSEPASEALAVTLNETGGMSWERMVSLTGLSVKQLRAELGSQVFQNPEGQWETADEYLSGNVRAKLRTAEAAAAINPLFLRNVEALKAVQPEDIL